MPVALDGPEIFSGQTDDGRIGFGYGIEIVPINRLDDFYGKKCLDKGTEVAVMSIPDSSDYFLSSSLADHQDQVIDWLVDNLVKERLDDVKRQVRDQLVIGFFRVKRIGIPL